MCAATTGVAVNVFPHVSFIGLDFCHVRSELCSEVLFATFICAGFLSSQQFDTLAFKYEKHRTLGVVPGYQYEIRCTDNGAIPIWYYNGQKVTDSASAAVYQISEAPNAKTLKFSEFSSDQVGEYTCSKPCGNCTMDISTGEIQLCVFVHVCMCVWVCF